MSLNLSGQTPYELTLDNNTGITSFLATDFNVNNKGHYKGQASFERSI